MTLPDDPVGVFIRKCFRSFAELLYISMTVICCFYALPNRLDNFLYIMYIYFIHTYIPTYHHGFRNIITNNNYKTNF